MNKIQNKIQLIRVKKIYLYCTIIINTFLASISLAYAQNNESQPTGNQGIFLEEHQIFYIVIGVAIGSLYGFCLIFMLILNSRGGTIKRLLENAGLAQIATELIKILNKNNTDLISSLVEGITIVLVVISIIILGLSGLLGSEGIIGILSAIVGYVLGSSRSYDKGDIHKEKHPLQPSSPTTNSPINPPINPDNANTQNNNNDNT